MRRRRWVVAVEFFTNDSKGVCSTANIVEYVENAVSELHTEYPKGDPRRANITLVRVKRIREMKG